MLLPDQSFDVVGLYLPGHRLAMTYAQKQNITNHNIGSMFDGIQRTVATPIANPSIES